MNDLNKTASVLLEYERIKANVAQDPSCCRELDSFLQMADLKPILKLPFLAMEDTICGKKEKYTLIAETWMQEEEDTSGWVLLALADTLEQMSRMIYEHYRTLQNLFQSKLDDYLSQEFSRDVMAGLAILKACKLELVLTEHYVEEGLRRVKLSDRNLEVVIDKSMEKEFENLAEISCKVIKETWGMEDGE
jgi:hypothetical protein